MADEEEKELTISFDQSSNLDDKGIFMLWGEITPKLSFEVVDFILRHNLYKEDEELDHLTILINSCGGMIAETAAIVEMMRLSTLPIHTYGIGNIASAAGDIIGAGKKGHRYLFRNTMIMTHRWASRTDIGGKGNGISLKKYIETTDAIVLDMIMDATGLSKKEALKKVLTDHDNYLTCQEAIALGLADQVVKKFPF